MLFVCDEETIEEVGTELVPPEKTELASEALSEVAVRVAAKTLQEEGV